MVEITPGHEFLKKVYIALRLGIRSFQKNSLLTINLGNKVIPLAITLL